ncbi:hypothetical protein ABK040_005623 [Willaertia magna]
MKSLAVYLTLLTTILLSLIVLNVNSAINKIEVSGGTNAGANEFPHLVSIQYVKSGYSSQHFCGGTIVGKKSIVTAAHCLDVPIPITSMQIVAGTNQRECGNSQQQGSNCIIRKVVRKVQHPQYDKNRIVNDIAVIEVDQEFPLDTQPQKVKAASLLLGSFPMGSPAIVAGWGRNLDSSNDIPSITQKAYVPVQQANFCNSKRLGMNPPSQVCAGEGRGINSCQGDSGGPLGVWRNGYFLLLGAVSYGPEGCGRQGSVAVYTNVTYYKDFVRSYVNDLTGMNYVDNSSPTNPTNPSNPSNPGCQCN